MRRKGAIPVTVAAILVPLGIEPNKWINGAKHFNSRFYFVAGATDVLQAWCERL